MHGSDSQAPDTVCMCKHRDYDAEKKQWGWARPAPVSQKQGGEPDTPKKLRKKVPALTTLCGCTPQLKMKNWGPKLCPVRPLLHIAYISCNSASFAYDSA